MGFREHAALYFIRKDDPCRAVWEPRLIESFDTGLPLRISFRIKNQEITAVIPAEAPPQP